MKNFTKLIFALLFAFTQAFTTQAQTTSAISACGDFTSGPAAWPYVLTATTIADGAASQASQTFTMNVTSLPTGGADFRVFKTTANQSSFFGPATALTLGSNTITVAAVAFDRAVKFQFSSGAVVFDALSVNGTASSCTAPLTVDLSLQGVLELDLLSGGSNGKGIHVRAINNIADLSVYGIGIANNGGGTDGMEWPFPAISVLAGEDIMVYRDSTELSSYFGSCWSEFDHVLSATYHISQSGDDAVELFRQTTAGDYVVETFGDINVDGTGQAWEYTNSYAYKINPGTTGSFVISDWFFAPLNCEFDATSAYSSTCPLYPICPPQFTYTVNMIDSWGDGWDGASWTATSTSTGTIYGPYTISSAQGASNTETFTTFDPCFTIAVGGGSFAGEHSWTLDSAGVQILSGGDPYSGSFGACTYGCTDPAYGNYDASVDFDDGSCTNNYTLTMDDSWGDGWNGATWTATSINSTFGPFTCTGSQTVETFSSSDDCFSVVVTSGSFPGEITWSLDSDGTNLFTNEVAPYSGNWGTCLPGCTDPNAGNYNSTANLEDGSCTYPCLDSDTSESFETNLGMWEQDSGDDFDWTRDAFGTTSSSTGPSTGLDGSYYMYIETSSGLTGATANLIIPCIDPSSWTSAGFVFGYHMYGATIGTLNVDVSDDNGATWTNVWTLSGDQGNQWYEAYVGLGSYTSQIDLRIQGVKGTSFSGDIAIDYTRLMNVAAGCTDPTLCGYDSLALVDDGSCGDPAYTLTMYDSFGDGWSGNTFDVVDANGVTLSSSTLASGALGTETLCIPNGCVTISCGGGTWASEVSWDITDYSGNIIASGGAPYSGSLCLPIVFGCTDPALCNYDPLAAVDDGSCGDPAYVLEMIDSFGDGWNGNTFNVTDAGGNLISSSTLSSGAFGTDDLCLADDPSCYTITCDNGSWQTEVSWNLKTLDGIIILSGGAPYTGQLCLPAAIGCTDPLACNYDSTATIDDGSCSSTYYLTMSDSYGDGWNGNTFDIAGSSYTIASGSTGTETVCLTDICHPITCGGGSFAYEVSWTLANSDGVVILSGGAPFVDTLCLPVAVGCMDTLSIDYDPLATVDDGSCTYPCIESDSTSSFETGLEMWVQDSSDDFDWTSRSGSTPSSFTGPTAAFDGANYMFIETSSGLTGATANLIIPCVDVSFFAAAYLSFAYHMYGATTGTLNVDASDDGGVTWTNLWTLSGDQGNVWNQANVDLSSYSGQIDVRVQGIKGSSYTGDIAIDLTSIYSPVFGCMETGASNYDPLADTDDGSCVYSATFEVDMSCEDPSTFTTVHLESPVFNCFTGCTQMTDPDGDLMFSVTVDVPLGNFTYLYSIDNNSSQENLIDDMINGATCAPITDFFSYANRQMVIIDGLNSASDVYGSCDPCLSGCTDTAANNYDPISLVDDGSCEYNVTFVVDMNCSGLTPTMVAATGYADNWSANTYVLNDADGDGIWEGTYSVTDNFVYMYAVDNYATSEYFGLLSELQNGTNSCAPFTDGISYAYRMAAAPSTTSDTYGQCSSCPPGCTDPAASNYNSGAQVDDGSCVYATTFNVDMNCEPAGSFGFVHLESPAFGWCGGCVPLADADGDGIHSVTVDLPLGNFEYKYAVDYWAGQENLIDDMVNGATCAPITDYANYANRLVDVSAGTILDDTYGSCDTCDQQYGCTDDGAINFDAFATLDDGSCLFSTTFNVDMNCEPAGSFGYVHLESPVFGWCGGCVPMTDADGDGVHSVTVDLPAGNFEYKYAVDGFSGQEDLIDDMVNGASCAPVTDYFSYANRLLNVNGPFETGSELITDGDGVITSSAWVFGHGWASINDEFDLFCYNDSATSSLYQSPVITLGKTYVLRFDATVNSGYTELRGFGESVLLTIDTTKSYEYTFVADRNMIKFETPALTIADLTLDNISLLEIDFENSISTSDTYGSCGECILGCTDSLAFNYSDSAMVDDGSCLYGYNCPAPYPIGLNSSDIYAEMATINWTDANNGSCMVEKYFVRYREVGTMAWITKSAGAGSGLCNVGLPNTSKVLRNLMPSTTYEYKLKAFYCGGGESGYSYLDQFTTLDACPKMDTLMVETFGSNDAKARFTWTETGPYTFARVALRVNTVGSAWQTAGGFGVYYPTLSVMKFGLISGTEYRAQGRTFCDVNVTSYRSDWTIPITWTQPGVAPIRLEGGNAINNLEVYPNPSKDIFNVSFVSEDVQNLEVRVLNMVGELIYNEGLEQFVGEYTKSINMSNYTKGVYFLEITTNNGVVNKKIVLQ